jgi:hypothetical protein
MAVGVGHIRTAPVNVGQRRPSFCWYSFAFHSTARGVGHIFATASNPTCTFLPLWYAVAPRQSVTCATDLPPFGTLGVGHQPEPVTSVRGANGGSGYAIPLRVIPARGQVSENSPESSSKESCDVLHDDVAGS